MGTGQPLNIPFPKTTFPGANFQESAGRLVNCYTEPLGDPRDQNTGAPMNAVVYRRLPGLTQFAMTAQTGYRGGIVASNTSYEVFNNLVTLDSLGNVTPLGSFPGNLPVSLAINQNATTPDVVAVDPAQGAFVLNSSTIAGPYPKNYTGGGILPQPNSVSFQDGYFFFTIADGRVFASGINALTQNALTFGRVISKADVTLLRGIAYQGYMFFFTTGSCEVWNDQANPAPNFPYGRNAILAYGLIQGTAIAGFETGFDDLIWVAQDFGVYRMPQGSLTPTKISNSDLDRAIAKQIRAGDTLQASVYIFSGKKVWVLSSAAFTWQFHLDTQQWFERSSLQPNGTQGRWRGTLGHLAFGKWLMGDQQSKAILYLDETNYADTSVQDPTSLITVNSPMLWRVESGMVDKFPMRARVARADFHFVQGVGSPVGQLILIVTGAAAGTGGVVRLALASTVGANTGDQVQVSGVLGTTEANGLWPITIIDSQHLELVGSKFVNPYSGGGRVVDTVLRPDTQNPTVAVSWSDDGGLTFRPPVLRNLGEQSVIKTGRIAVKAAGMTGIIGRRWRLDVSAPVYTAFLRGTQSDSPTTPN